MYQKIALTVKFALGFQQKKRLLEMCGAHFAVSQLRKINVMTLNGKPLV